MPPKSVSHADARAIASRLEALLGELSGIRSFHTYVEERPPVIWAQVHADDVTATDNALRQAFGDHAALIDLEFEQWPTSSIGLGSCTVDASGLQVTADGTTGAMHRDPRLEIEERDDSVTVRLMCEAASDPTPSSWTTGQSQIESAFAAVGYMFHETARLSRPLGDRNLVWTRDRG